MTFLKLAWRNVLRNRRRSAITVTAIAFGLAALIFLWAFVDGVNNQMIDNSTRYLSGHVQVHRTGYHAQKTLDLMLEQDDGMRRWLQSQANVASVARRLEGSAIISRGDKSRGVLVIGIEPEQEKKVTTLYDTLRQGRYLHAEDGNAVVLGDAAASSLKVDIGGEVVLVTQGADGSVGAARYTVVGIFDTRMDMLDGNYVFLPLAAAQELFSATGAITGVAARLDSRTATDTVVAAARRQAGEAREVLGWQQLLPNVMQSVEFHEVVAYILLLVLFVVVAVGITNTVLMSVMERTREFGVIMALGTGEAPVTRLVFYEACLLGLAGLAGGALAGLSLTHYFAAAGIDLGRYNQAMEVMEGLTGTVYPLPRLDRTLTVSMLVFSTAVIAAIFPAWKASRLNPVDAMRGRAGKTSLLPRLHSLHVTRLDFSLPLFVRIAARSMIRNPRRTALTVSSTAFGLAAFLFLYSFVDGYFAQMVDNSTGYLTGDMQIQHRLLRQELEPALVIRDAARLQGELERHPEVAAVAPRVQAQVLVSSPTVSQNVLLIGIDPDKEQSVTFVDRTVRQGTALKHGQDKDIVLGRKLADKLQARLGEKVVVMTQTAGNALGSAAFRIAGIFETESEAFDNAIGFVTLRAGQSLLELGDNVSAMAIRLRDRDRLEAAAASLSASLSGTDYMTITWRALLPEVSQMIDYVKMNLRLVVGIVFFVVAMGVMNTLLMSVMERTREFGIMMALGTRPGQIVRLVFYESMVLAAIGIAAGCLLGLALVGYLSVRGIDLTVYTKGLQTVPGLTGIIYPRMQREHVVVPAALLLAVSAVAALYPGLRAARLRPVEAIRHA